MLYTSPLCSVVVSAVKKAANSLIRDFNEVEKLQSSMKSYKEFVANSYGKIERELKKELGKVKPDFPYREENKPAPAGPYFAISPLEGIMNFAHGIGVFSVSVAVCNGSDVILGVVYNPVSDEMFFAEKGKGTFKEGSRNAERLRVSGRKELSEALVSVPGRHYRKAASITDGLRFSGSVSLDLANAASGKLDIVIGENVRFVDIAAGALLVKEAGGYVLNPNQKDGKTENLIEVINSGAIIAVNANLNKKACDLIK